MVENCRPSRSVVCGVPGVTRRGRNSGNRSRSIRQRQHDYHGYLYGDHAANAYRTRPSAAGTSCARLGGGGRRSSTDTRASTARPQGLHLPSASTGTFGREWRRNMALPVLASKWRPILDANRQDARPVPSVFFFPASSSEGCVLRPYGLGARQLGLVTKPLSPTRTRFRILGHPTTRSRTTARVAGRVHVRRNELVRLHGIAVQRCHQ
jgi:hypothetical protein